MRNGSIYCSSLDLIFAILRTARSCRKSGASNESYPSLSSAASRSGNTSITISRNAFGSYLSGAGIMNKDVSITGHRSTMWTLGSSVCPTHGPFRLLECHGTRL